MSERPPSESLDTRHIGEKTLRQWHAYLTTDRETGEDTGRLDVPDSRYGRTGGDVAYWAIAAAMVLEHANGYLDDAENTMDSLMSDAVNDQPDIASAVHHYLWLIPDDLQAQLDWDGFNNR